MVQGAIAVKAISITRDPESGHHSIPVYLCGRVAQPLVPVNSVVHQFLHSSMVAWTGGADAILSTAFQAAHPRMFSYTRGAKRGIRTMASSDLSRVAIAQAIDVF
jgi:hypothetical protein